MRGEEEVVQAIERYADTVVRLCMVYLGNRADADDVFQTVMLRYALSETAFEDVEHEKAWVIRVTINACKDMLKSAARNRSISLEAASSVPADVSEEHQEVLDAVMVLPEKYRDVIYLHYYEGYTAPEIGKLLGKNANTVYTLLKRARKRLEKELGGEGNGA